MRSAVGDILQVGLGELPASTKFFHFDIAWAYHQGMVLAQLAQGRCISQQPLNGILGLLQVQREDLLGAQVVSLEDGVTMREALNAVPPELPPDGRRRVLQGLHDVEGGQRHDGTKSREDPQLVTALVACLVFGIPLPLSYS